MSVLRNLNYIQEISRIPCAQPDPLLVIKTAFEAAPPALLQLGLPGCSEIVQARAGIAPGQGFGELVKQATDRGARPRRGGRHGKRYSAPVQRAHRGLPLGGRQFLYRTGFFAAERLLWYWLVADVTTAFIAQWTSLIYQEMNCDQPGAGTFRADIQPFIYTAGDSVLNFSTPSLPGCGHARNADITIAPGVNASIIFDMQWEPWPNSSAPSANITTWLYEVGVEKSLAEATMNDPIQQNGKRTGGRHNHRNNGQITPRRYRIGVHNPSPTAAMRPVLGTVHVGCMGFATGQPWGCKPKPLEWPDWATKWQ